MFYSIIASLMLLSATSAYAQPSKSTFTVIRDEYKSKFISDCLQSFPSSDTKLTLASKTSYCTCFYWKLLSRYGFENLTSIDSILRRSDQSIRNFANIAWSPETTACRSALK